MRALRIHLAAALASALVSASVRADEPLRPPPLVRSEGEPVAPPSAAPQPGALPPPAPVPPPVAPAPEPLAIKVTGVKVEAPPAAAAPSELRNAVSIDLVHLAMIAGPITYERRFRSRIGGTIGVRVPFTLAPSTPQTNLADGVAFIDTAFPWVYVGGRYQFFGPEFRGVFAGLAVGATLVRSMWTATKPGVVIPTKDIPVCSPSSSVTKWYCLIAPAWSIEALAGYSHVLFDRLYLAADVGFQLGFGGAQVDWDSATRRHYSHFFRPPLFTLTGSAAVGYAF